MLSDEFCGSSRNYYGELLTFWFDLAMESIRPNFIMQ